MGQYGRHSPLQWIISALELIGRDQQQRSTCYRTYQWPEHRQSRSHHCSCTFANQRLLHLSSERLYPRLALPSGEANHTFYILHSMWLCTICWYPDDGVPCLAFSRWHEIKSKSPKYFCFCSCCDKPLHCSSHQHLLWSCISLNLLISVCQCQDSQWTNIAIQNELCYYTEGNNVTHVAKSMRNFFKSLLALTSPVHPNAKCRSSGVFLMCPIFLVLFWFSQCGWLYLFKCNRGRSRAHNFQ